MSHIADVELPERRALQRDVLVAALAGQPWSDVVVHDSIGSTNAELLADPAPWRVVTTDHQAAGRGRLTRTWQAPPRSSIAVSASLPLPRDHADWGWVPLLVGTTVRAAVGDLAPVDVGLKWPNDVLARPSGSGEQPWRKLAGILCQTATPAGGAPVVVVGVGLNVDQKADELPVETATSLRLCGAGAVDRTALVARLLSGLVDLQRAWAAGDLQTLRSAYRDACVTLGRQVDVHLPDGTVRRGEATATDTDGRLVVRAADGEVAHAVGDIVHARPVADDQGEVR
ncbi:biotin--[acetyl-CoA-carboxylase] ligase [Luteipulveratus halotolerans]|uniref:biotin--[biotin carboxyl-carrier protein] ligase n=1 Tax=Luteipulveratus halotolerans TaxID=1631356 RepID=A0A0L6CJ03_9MICO|nr:biotin--[acetyl-CoA-carboxylase] ligase [Luteipulveratus halotolerans]KNX37781.1 hypothetical protein VV01_12490 [Luteipulveratus halotolerans]